MAVAGLPDDSIAVRKDYNLSLGTVSPGKPASDSTCFLICRAIRSFFVSRER